MRAIVIAACCFALLGCGGGGGGDASVNNDPAIIGSWTYRSDGQAYDAQGCGGNGSSTAAQRLKMTFDGQTFTQLIETCYLTVAGYGFQVTRDDKGTYVTGALLSTLTTSSNGAVIEEIKVKAIDVHNTTRDRTTFSSYGINAAGNLILAVASGAADGSTSALRRVDIENGTVLTKLN